MKHNTAQKARARRGLELVAAGWAYDRLRRFRGNVKFRIKVSELRLAILSRESFDLFEIKKMPCWRR